MTASYSQTDAAINNDNLSVYTFEDFSFGAEAADRRVIVKPGARSSGSGSYNSVPVSVTVDGVAATLLEDLNVADGINHIGAALWAAPLPTGTSGDVVVTYAGTQLRAGCVVGPLLGAQATPYATETNSTLITPETTIAVPAGGVCLSLAVSQPPGSGGEAIWTGLTRDYDRLLENNVFGVSAASDDFASAQAALAVQADWSATQSTGTSAMVTVAFAPSQGSILQRPATHPLTDELTYPLTYGVA